MCVAMAKLSMALAWLYCVRLRERPEFKAYFMANYMSIGVVNEQLPSFWGGKGQAATGTR